MDVKQLPERPDLGQYKKQAKDLLRAFQTGEADAVLRVRARHPRFGRVKEADVSGAPFTLIDAQLTLAREHGFESWPKFSKHIEALGREGSPDSRFEKAVEAIVSGDLETLERLLREDPELVRERSARRHAATLLHYVAANGIEDFRQKTPKNAVLIAKTLIGAGAEVDATLADGTSTTLGLAASSIHPERSGVAVELIEALLDAGAALDGLALGAEPLMWAITNGRGVAAETLARRGARVENIVAAAALGRMDLVARYMTEAGSKAWGVAEDEQTRREQAFIWACMYGRTAVVEFLLDQGVDASAGAVKGQTGLHLAAHAGRVETVRALIARKAPLEVKNMFGGTVLDQAVWSAVHERRPGHLEIIEMLLKAGANAEEAGYPTRVAEIDEMLRKFLR